MSVYLLKHKEHGDKQGGLFDRILQGYHGLVDMFVEHRFWSFRSISAPRSWSSGLLGMEVGTELFPQIDQGEFVLRFRPPAGSSYELTREMGLKCLQEIEHEAGPRMSRSPWASWARSPRTSASTIWCSSCAGRTTAGCGSP